MRLLVNTMRTETNRSTGLREEIEALRHMTVGQLNDKYRDVFSESSRSNHKQFLFRRIAWRMQANAYGGLSERARRRALEIADDADLRIRAPKNFLKVDLDESRTLETRVAPTEDPRLPSRGTELVRPRARLRVRNGGLAGGQTVSDPGGLPRGAWRCGYPAGVGAAACQLRRRGAERGAAGGCGADVSGAFAAPRRRGDEGAGGGL